MDVKELKRVNLEQDEEFQKATAEINSFVDELKAKESQMLSIVKEALKKGLFSEDLQKEYATKDMQGEEEVYPFLWNALPKKNTLSDERIREKLEKIEDEWYALLTALEKARKRIAEKYRYSVDSPYFEKRDLSGVNYLCPLDQEPWPNTPFKDFDFRNEVVESKLLCLQIDLTYDKKEILESIDDIVAEAKKLIGNFPGKGKPKGAEKREQHEYIERKFLEYYDSGDTATKAGEKAAKDLKRTFNIDRKGKWLRRRYAPKIKKKFDAPTLKDVRKRNKDK